jgi:hypothetical protein
VEAVAEEEASIDGGGGDRQSATSTVIVVTGRVESSGVLESFGMKSEMTRGRLLFMSSKYQQRFYFKTVADSFGIRTEAVLVSNHY